VGSENWIASGLCRSAALRSGLRQRGGIFRSSLPRPNPSARLSSKGVAPRERTGLTSVAPPALWAWAALACVAHLISLCFFPLREQGVPPSSWKAGRWFFSWSEGWEIKSAAPGGFDHHQMSISAVSDIRIDRNYLPPFCSEEKSPSSQKDGAPGAARLWTQIKARLSGGL
jgi:hypothetical protein